MDIANYETLFLAKPEITEDELTNIERSFEKILETHKGEVAVFDRWGKYLLAYPVAKNSYGVYALARYKVPQVNLKKVHKEIDTFLRIKCHDTILRFVTVKLEGDANDPYPRPEPIDNSKSGLDSLKKSKIENLLDSVDSSSIKNSSDSEPTPTESTAPETSAKSKNPTSSLSTTSENESNPSTNDSEPAKGTSISEQTTEIKKSVESSTKDSEEPSDK